MSIWKNAEEVPEAGRAVLVIGHDELCCTAIEHIPDNDEKAEWVEDWKRSALIKTHNGGTYYPEFDAPPEAVPTRLRWCYLQDLIEAAERAEDHAAEVERLRGLLSELHATVKGECPRLYGEDSDGKAILELAIEQALTNEGGA